MTTYTYYQELVKPAWAPPAWLFGPVWTALYAIIIVSFGKVFWMAWQGEVPGLVAVPFVLNLIFNLSYTWLQFGLRNNTLASIDVLLVLGTLVWAMVAIWPYVRWVAYANVPYLLWVSFATVLQLAITLLNR
jgi:translocator protein